MGSHGRYSSGIDMSEKIASTGHSGRHASQSMQVSGFINSLSGSSWNASTGQTAAQSVYLHSTQGSVTIYVISAKRLLLKEPGHSQPRHSRELNKLEP